MKKPTYLLIILLLTACEVAKWPTQKYIDAKNYEEVIGQISQDNKVPERYAMYPNGRKGISLLIVKNLTYPKESRVAGVTGQVLIRYVVEKDGYIKNIEVVRSVNPYLDKESIRVIKLMDRWVPGLKEGKPVAVEYLQPFTFKIN